MYKNTVNIYIKDVSDTIRDDILAPKAPESSPAFKNAEGTARELAEKAPDADAMEAAMAHYGLPSVKINPFLARPVNLGELQGIIGDGCIFLPAVLGGEGKATDWRNLREGQSTTWGVITTSKGVFYQTIKMVSRAGDKLADGDEMRIALQNAAGKWIIEDNIMIRVTEDDIMMRPKKCKCLKDILKPTPTFPEPVDFNF